MAENDIPQSIYIRLSTGTTSAAEAMKTLGETIGAMNISLKPSPSISSGVNSNTLNVTNGPVPLKSVNTWTTQQAWPVGSVHRVDSQTWQVGDEQIAEFALIALVKEYRRRQDMIANRPKFTSVEQAEKWLEAAS